jgi:hypothetical protein
MAKVQTLDLGVPAKILYSLGLVPLTTVALFMAAFRFPRYADQRRSILSKRPHGRTWLLKELWKRRRPHHESPGSD